MVKGGRGNAVHQEPGETSQRQVQVQPADKYTEGHHCVTSLNDITRAIKE
jgi:hypothetical protein